MKNNVFIKAAIASLIASQSYANDIYFVQPGANSSGIGTLIIEQDVAGTAVDQIGTSGSPSVFEGALTSVTIKQMSSDSTYSNTNNASNNSGVNTADIEYYGATSSTSTFGAIFTGSSNDYDFTLGATGDGGYGDVAYSLIVGGSDNQITDTVTSSANSGDNLIYTGMIVGNKNTVTVDIAGAVDDASIIYDIDGDSNVLDIMAAGGGAATTDARVINASISGGLLSPTGNVDFDTGSTLATNVNLYIDQYGTSNFDVDIVQVANTGVVNAYITDSTYAQCGSTGTTCMGDWSNRGAQSAADGTTANVNVYTHGAATFKMAQNTNGATYVGDVTIAAGGSASIQQ